MFALSGAEEPSNLDIKKIVYVKNVHYHVISMDINTEHTHIVVSDQSKTHHGTVFSAATSTSERQRTNKLKHG